jgi:hypothetical protein
LENNAKQNLHIKISSNLGFKATKDQITVLLGGNPNGDYKLRPFVVLSFTNPLGILRDMEVSLTCSLSLQQNGMDN